MAARVDCVNYTVSRVPRPPGSKARGQAHRQFFWQPRHIILMDNPRSRLENRNKPEEPGDTLARTTLVALLFPYLAPANRLDEACE